ncbi:MAG: hypothetical protein WCI03_13580 [bacterium]|jgi:hypothetical protein
MESAINTVVAYSLRTPDGTVYGPVDIVTLCVWATDARVIPGCEWSENRDVWFPVEKIPELRLNWSVQFADGTLYGPLNLLAIWVLASENSIPPGVKLSELGTKREAILDHSLLPLLVEEFHQMLAGCGALMSTALVALRGAHRGVLNEAEECSSRLRALKAKLENADQDLAVSMRLNEALSHQLSEAQKTLQNRDAEIRKLESAATQDKAQADTQIQQLESAVAQGKIRTDTQIRKLESEVALGKNQAEAQAIEMRSKITALEEAQQRASLLATQLVHVQEGAQKLLTEERAAWLKESQGALQKKETLIQQLEAAVAHGKMQADSQATEMQSKIALGDKALQEVQQRSVALIAQLAQAQENYQVLVHESASKEKESAVKFQQIEQDVLASTELVAKTMREVDRREGQLRDLQKKLDEKRPVFSTQGTVVEAEVIHTEVLQAEVLVTEEAGDWTEVSGSGQPDKADGKHEKTGNTSGILNSVEARLQQELRQWEVLKREQENQKRTGGKWFRRK